MLDGWPPPIISSERDLTRKERSTKIPIVDSWAPTRAESRRMPASTSVPTVACRHMMKASLRLPGSPDYNDTIRLMEQTDGRCPGTQLS